MALIICPECKQQISDQATACPKCGYPLKKEPVPTTEDLNDPDAVCITETAATVAKEDVEPIEAAEVPESVKENQKPKKGKRKGIIIGCVAVVCAVLAIAIGVTSSQNSKKAAARAEYIANLNSFLSESLDGGAEAEKACNLTYKVWYDTIHEEYRSETVAYTKTNGSFNDDFNDSLIALYTSDEMLAMIADIEANQIVVDEIYKALQNPTDEFSSCYDAVDDLYSAYYNLTKLAVSPSGSLNSYSTNFSTYDSEYMEYYNKLKLLIPEE